ncbi:hypothetical protein [Streptomyces sp. NBC_01240]|uniref:hypothetical protein n=1 Tax=Streptomyces sp. NBC_01240 TaxID=2903793 RepID=UPI002E10BEF5|nr:hypothetical protein OG466_34275 [Streptomyces sp. NBC_01240]
MRAKPIALLGSDYLDSFLQMKGPELLVSSCSHPSRHQASPRRRKSPSNRLRIPARTQLLPRDGGRQGAGQLPLLTLERVEQPVLHKAATLLVGVGEQGELIARQGTMSPCVDQILPLRKAIKPGLSDGIFVGAVAAR